MDAEYLIVNHHTKRQEVKHVCKVVPHIGITVLPRTFRIKAVALRHAATLVVASYKMNPVWVPKLEADKKRDGFDREHAAVHVVTEEEVIGVWAEAANLEDLYQVEELTVDVAYDGDGGAHVHHVRLAHQQLLSLCAYCLDDGLGKEVFFVEPFYAFVEIDGSCFA